MIPFCRILSSFSRKLRVIRFSSETASTRAQRNVVIVVKTSGKKFLKVEVNKVIRFLTAIVKACTFLSFVSKKDSLYVSGDRVDITLEMEQRAKRDAM